ncbi:serine 3-dehydrogenase [Pseudomonas lini]|uniref:Serine 3-dehydrogenase n=1 Tax=Pseudomonas lini TaxID=163011 RepID=A0A7V7P837_9PSED|nr:matrixin family metalloprotease [Pseudomonas lini]KAB0508142.1 serine 3-dehydrogenase [Pseudomonas lini]
MPRPTGYTDSLSSSLTGFKAVDSLISGFQWESSKWWMPGAVTNLTYSFITPGMAYFATNYSADNEYKNMYALTAAQQTAITGALASWSAVANITFRLTTDNATNVGDLRFGGYTQMDNTAAAWAYFPSDDPNGGDVWIGPNTNDATPDKGSYDFMTFIHEIGHAVGLKHPFSPGGSNTITLDPALDDVSLTVMSYNNSYSYQPTTPMLLDILAIQSLYGVNNLWMTGNNVYSWAPTQSVFETIWDAGGNDSIDASNQLAAVRINLNEGQFSQIGQAFTDQNGDAFNEGLAIAFGAKIENAYGSAFDDSLIGNALGNLLNGMSGADTMDGGAGNDSYIVDSVGDVVIERGLMLSEIDTVYSYIDYTLGNNIENLILVDGANLNGTGNTLNNVITGNMGGNLLDGGLGADTLIGGAGNDTYIVDNLGDMAIETSTLAGEIDTVRSSSSYILSNNLEILTLTGTANTYGIGNALNNVITGNDGNNQLNGAAGVDTLIGGKGNDDYFLDQTGELALVQENTNEGTDSLYVVYNATAQTNTVDLNLSNLHNIENVLLLGAGAFTALGNDLNNTLTGNADSNILDGGLGADTLIGGAGNDTYIVDNLGDVAIETGTLAGEIDTVRSSMSYILGANLENLELTGTANTYGIGNALNNVITGNDGNNQLNGAAGVDTLIGGKGNDDYFLDQAGELTLVQEIVSEGTDTLYVVYNSTTQVIGLPSMIDLNLSNLRNVENVLLLGAGAFTALGNDLNNTLTGNAADNVLDGSLGADTLIGGAGNDSYVVDNLGDVVIETSTLASEIDTVYSLIDYTLGSNVENLMLQGSGNLNGTGNALNNVINGYIGNNILNGGLGADVMSGGDGNDTYIVDNISDMAIETSTLAGEIDTVRSSVSYILGANLENLELTGTANTYGIGNALNNVITGNDGNNQLNGAAGVDTLIGGKGNDDYFLDQVGELALVQEIVSEGTDTLYVVYNATAQTNTIDLNLSNLHNVENVLLLGSGAFTALGNDLNNTLTGNTANNILDGGIGTDTLTGGAGADKFVFSALNEMGTGANRDVITDFSSLQGDKIDLTNFDANLVSAGFNGFSFIGANDFTGAGQLRFVDHMLYGNVNGDLGSDFEIQLVGVNTFSANDLVA